MRVNQTPAAAEVYTARFRGLKTHGSYSNNVLPGMFDIQIRPVKGSPHLFETFFENNPRAVSARPRTLQQAKESARLLFIEQITEWRVLDRA